MKGCTGRAATRTRLAGWWWWSTIACLGCGEQGVRVVVTAEATVITAATPYDWIEVTASGAREARACLFPEREIPNAVAVPQGVSCADQQQTPRDDSFSFASWAFELERSVNFRGEADAVEVWATAGFGSSTGPSATPVATASDQPFSAITLQLTGGEAIFGAGRCDLALAPVGGSVPSCSAPPSACAGAPPSYTSAVSCAPDGAGLRIDNREPTCADDVVWRGEVGALAPGARARVTVTGHFARCSEPECALSTDCDPPPTYLALMTRTTSGVEDEVDGRALDCAPPRAGPVTLSFVTAPAAQGDPDAYLEIRQPRLTGERACFFELRSIEWGD